MDVLSKFKCPSCGGVLAFDSDSQRLKCSYCDSLYDTDLFEGCDAQTAEPFEEDEHVWDQSESELFDYYECPSCGAQTMFDSTVSATSCPYCGSSIVFMGKLQGVFRPDQIIPFKLDKRAAEEAFARHLKGKVLLPKAFKRESRINEIKGVYIPVWLYDSDAEAEMTFRGTKERHWSDDDYDYEEISYYRVRRTGKMSFCDLPVNAASGISGALTESLEPYYTDASEDFSSGYLIGYMANKYDVSAADGVHRAYERMRNTSERMVRRSIHGYDSLHCQHSNVSFSGTRVCYALHPAWMLGATWRGQSYTFAMNGQTGTFVGDLPMDRRAFWRWFLGLSAGVSALIFAILCAVYYYM